MATAAERPAMLKMTAIVKVMYGQCSLWEDELCDTKEHNVIVA